MYQQLIEKLKPGLEKTLQYLKSELVSLSVGRATPAMVEDLEVESYGQRFALKQLAAISAPEPRVIVIRPWDANIIKEIESAIRNARLGLSPVAETEIIRLNIPALSEERRKELVKIVREKEEECKISVRRQREEVWKEIQRLEKEDEISEDDKFRAKDKLQEAVDDYNKKIEETAKKKEEEIMKV